MALALKDASHGSVLENGRGVLEGGADGPSDGERVSSRYLDGAAKHDGG